MQLQPTCIVGTKTPQFCGNRSELQDYNPRASWVLKLQSKIASRIHLFYYNPRASWILKQYDHRYMLAINIEMKKLYFKMAIKKRH